MEKSLETKVFNTTVVVSALGYFVDIYDLVLFGIVRVASLRSIGIPEDQLLEVGVYLFNAQMIGMLLGGILWGVLGDKRGRVSVLFGSILLYSLANIANAFVQTADQYAILRFLAGVGLAGELGAAITLVSETMTKETRGIGTTIVASVGICGAVVAALIGDLFSWKVAYIIGGVLGLMLLAARFAMFESGLFEKCAHSKISRGSFFILLNHPKRFLKFLGCILVGVPIWFVIGILVILSPELSRALNVEGMISAGSSIMYCYIGLALGDLGSGLISQYFKSRKKVILGFVLLTAVLVGVYGVQDKWNTFAFYALCLGLGFGTGYWALFVTVASEQFGTNIRATVTTSVPNFVRGSVVPATLAFKALVPSLGLIQSVMTVGGVAIFLGLAGLYLLDETFGRDLNFLED